jgi:hypothetical protein
MKDQNIDVRENNLLLTSPKQSTKTASNLHTCISNVLDKLTSDFLPCRELQQKLVAFGIL